MGKRTRRAFPIQLVHGDLDPAAGPRARFLGRWDAADLRRELAEAGVLRALAERGYPDVDVQLSSEEGEHRLSVRPAGDTVSLIDLRMAEGTFPVEDEVLRACGQHVLSVLAVNWLALQDPRGVFTTERPQLPGQTHPGLGVSRLLFAHVLQWAGAWGKDAVLNYPEYFHNARFYSPPFVFVSARDQGWFEALCRDLALLPVASAAAALENGDVVEAESGEVVHWEGRPMAMPVSAALRACFESDGYRDAVARMRNRARFRVRPPMSSD
jgi:hypothetical protein